MESIIAELNAGNTSVLAVHLSFSNSPVCWSASRFAWYLVLVADCPPPPPRHEPLIMLNVYIFLVFLRLDVLKLCTVIYGRKSKHAIVYDWLTLQKQSLWHSHLTLLLIFRALAAKYYSLILTESHISPVAKLDLIFDWSWKCNARSYMLS